MAVVHHADHDRESGQHRCSRCGVALPSHCVPGLFVEELGEADAREFRRAGARRDGVRLCGI